MTASGIRWCAVFAYACEKLSLCTHRSSVNKRDTRFDSTGDVCLCYTCSMDYELLDSGDGMRFERVGPYRLVRPSASGNLDAATPEE